MAIGRSPKRGLMASVWDGAKRVIAKAAEELPGEALAETVYWHGLDPLLFGKGGHIHTREEDDVDKEGAKEKGEGKAKKAKPEAPKMTLPALLVAFATGALRAESEAKRVDLAEALQKQRLAGHPFVNIERLYDEARSKDGNAENTFVKVLCALHPSEDKVPEGRTAEGIFLERLRAFEDLPEDSDRKRIMALLEDDAMKQRVNALGTQAASGIQEGIKEFQRRAW